MTQHERDELLTWALDCFSDTPHDATDEELIACVEANYVGGLAQWLADGVAS